MLEFMQFHFPSYCFMTLTQTINYKNNELLSQLKTATLISFNQKKQQQRQQQ